MKRDRPTKYNKKLGERICKQIANGKSLLKISKLKNMPTRQTIHNWLLDKELKDFFDNYEKSCNVRAENMFDNLNEISDLSDKKESTNRSRLRVDTRKWYLSKIMPKKYGDKLDITSGNKPIPIINVQTNEGNDKDNSPDEKD